jgi:glycosyltransferase involved in cell wall biosynthesis
MNANSQKPATAILHYSAPPVVGGVEAVIHAHCKIFLQHGYPVTVVAGAGESSGLPVGAGFKLIPELDSQHERVEQMSALLAEGKIPHDFDELSAQLADQLQPLLQDFDTVIAHNLITKHFNLMFTAAVYRLLDAGVLHHLVAWCHDFTWTSSHSRHMVHDGYPWDLLRTYRPEITYVTISEERKADLVQLLGCPEDKVKVVYSGVDPRHLLGLSEETMDLVSRLGILDSDLAILMPVRVTQAKNIEYALQVVAALKQEGVQTVLVLTGPPDPHDSGNMEYFQELREVRKSLGVENEMRFVYESGPQPDQPFQIDMQTVGELFRVCDLVLMPSHREGFGMPVLEAGLVGTPVFCTSIPAAREIGKQDVTIFDLKMGPSLLAERIIQWMQQDPVYRLRQRVRKNYTWEAIFTQHIEPLINHSAA